MQYEKAGDPMTGLFWTKKTLQKISKELAKNNIKVGKTTVGKLLKKITLSNATIKKFLTAARNSPKRKN